MISCPVCEHQQAPQPFCELCGKALASPAAPEVVVSPVEGLELTRADEAGAMPQVAPLEELEATRQPPITVVAAPADPNVEHTSERLVGAVMVAPLEDMSEDRAPAIGGPTVLPEGPVTCRFCQNVQSTGIVCDRCGLRLPRRPGPPGASSAAPRPGAASGAGAGAWVRCFSCGAPVRAGARCRDCGNEQPRAE